MFRPPADGITGSGTGPAEDNTGDLNTCMTIATAPFPTMLVMSNPGPSLSALRLDVAVALLVVVLVTIGTSQVGAEPGERAIDGVALACAVLGAASLALWRRLPVVMVVAVSVVIAVYKARSYPGGPVVLPVPLSMLGLGYIASRWVAWGGVVALFVATLIGSLIAGGGIFFHLLLVVGWGAAAVLAGQALAAQGERVAAKRERQASAQEQALANERLRIAQDVHDSVAHAMATINVQSGVAAHLLEQKPEQAVVALEAIRTASRDALDELGAILGVLRHAESAAPRAPLAGVGDISELVDRARADGVTVSLDQEGDLGAVAPAVGAAAYRVVQEALTNTRRHAGPSAVVAARIAVGERGSLQVTVSDDGGGRALVDSSGSGGLGLVGMRERVEASGGSLNAGPTAGPGFMVEARWPDRVNP